MSKWLGRIIVAAAILMLLYRLIKSETLLNAMLLAEAKENAWLRQEHELYLEERMLETGMTRVEIEAEQHLHIAEIIREESAKS